MEYWTVLWITVLGGPLDGSTSGLIYPSEEVCVEQAKVVSDTLSYDHQLDCRETDIVSKLIRPMPRPDNLGG